MLTYPKINLFPDILTGVPKALLTDIGRGKYHLPLDGDSPERFLATKVPLRKNKDYRARFKNFVVGYPVIYHLTIGVQEGPLHETLLQLPRPHL